VSSSVRVDVNFLSLGEEGKTWVTYAGSEAAEIVENDETLLKLLKQLDQDREELASLLKISGRSFVDINGLNIGQGRECSVDINDRSTAVLSAGEYGSRNLKGDQVFSVKGFSTAIISGVFRGRGKRNKADVLIDNWSDQDYRGSLVNLSRSRHEDGKPINVVLRYGASKVILGENAKVLVPQSVGLTVYWWIKWTIRKILFIRVGQRGPKWI
jgi:hypothetical protein